MLAILIMLLLQGARPAVIETYKPEFQATYLQVDAVGIDRKSEKRLVQFIARYPGKSYSKPQTVSLTIETPRPIHPEDLRGIKVPLLVTVDDAAMPASHVTAAPATIAADTPGVTCLMPLATFQKIAAAKSASISLAGVEVALDKDQLASVKELSDRLK